MRQCLMTVRWRLFQGLDHMVAVKRRDCRSGITRSTAIVGRYFEEGGERVADNENPARNLVTPAAMQVPRLASSLK
jgi:hypothetical protein